MTRRRIEPSAKGKRARAWRERLGLTVTDLADLTGYSREAVQQYERGKRSDKHELSDWAWQRYSLCCAAVEHQQKTGRAFEW